MREETKDDTADDAQCSFWISLLSLLSSAHLWSAASCLEPPWRTRSPCHFTTFRELRYLKVCEEGKGRVRVIFSCITFF